MRVRLAAQSLRLPVVHRRDGSAQAAEDEPPDLGAGAVEPPELLELELSFFGAAALSPDPDFSLDVLFSPEPDELSLAADLPESDESPTEGDDVLRESVR